MKYPEVALIETLSFPSQVDLQINLRVIEPNAQ